MKLLDGSNQEQKAMMEKHDHHRKQYEKWLSISFIFACVGAVLPPLLLFLIPSFIKLNKHAKAFKELQKECLLRSLDGIDKDKYAKLYHYMINQKTWLG